MRLSALRRAKLGTLGLRYLDRLGRQDAPQFLRHRGRNLERPRLDDLGLKRTKPEFLPRWWGSSLRCIRRERTCNCRHGYVAAKLQDRARTRHGTTRKEGRGTKPAFT